MNARLTKRREQEIREALAETSESERDPADYVIAELLAEIDVLRSRDKPQSRGERVDPDVEEPLRLALKIGRAFTYEEARISWNEIDALRTRIGYGEKMRLRSILHSNGRETEAGVVLDATGNLRDWLIITVPDFENFTPQQHRRFGQAMIGRFGPKTCVVSKGVEFFVFERIE